MAEHEGVEYVEVVTRYGGHKHLAVMSAFGLPRHHTLCMGTSSWTLRSWRETPDHPLLTLAEIEALPACPRCAELTGRRAKVYRPEGYTPEQRAADTSFLVGARYGRDVALASLAAKIEQWRKAVKAGQFDQDVERAMDDFATLLGLDMGKGRGR